MSNLILDKNEWVVGIVTYVEEAGRHGPFCFVRCLKSKDNCIEKDKTVTFPKSILDEVEAGIVVVLRGPFRYKRAGWKAERAEFYTTTHDKDEQIKLTDEEKEKLKNEFKDKENEIK